MEYATATCNRACVAFINELVILACADEQCQIQTKKVNSLAVLPYDTEGLCAKDVACRLAKHAAVQCSSKQCKMRRMNALSSAAAGGNETST